MASALQSLPPSGSAVSDKTGDESKILSSGPQVAHQVPFQVCTLNSTSTVLAAASNFGLLWA